MPCLNLWIVCRMLSTKLAQTLLAFSQIVAGSSYVRSPRSQFRAFALHNGSARISFRTVRPFNIAEPSQFFHSCEVAKQHRKNKKALAEAGASWSDEAHAAGHLGDHAGPTRKERPLRNGFPAVCA